ncbi:MAG TPA: response regulator [Thermoanaerobaculia bacterium]|jgi:CheY-like chemotaxis protein|nr:response regulator [Thermoanaerobaculia bacterium]
MSLLGRLEDLSLTDIVQIVYLSRRTGVLEIVDDRGRHTVMFRQGLVVNASSPEHPDLLTYLVARGSVPEAAAPGLRKMEESGIPLGTAAVEMNIIPAAELATAIHERVVSVVAPLLQSREGEFNFILSDHVGPLDVEYDADSILKEGGFAPQKIVGAADGEKLKPLRSLEESMKVGKALLRSAATEPPSTLNLGLGHPKEPELTLVPDDNILPFPTPEEREEQTFTPVPDDEPFPAVETPPQAAPKPRTSAGQFKVAGGLIEVESPDATYRNVVLFERSPLIRVAAKRAFGRNRVKIAQFGTIDDARVAIGDYIRANTFFVTFLELTDQSDLLLQQLKRKNPRLPVVIIDAEADLRRRHDLLRRGADLYLTKPSPARLQPGLAEEELTLFADELVLFAERAFQQWERYTGGLDPDAGRRFYETAEKENVDRSFSLLKQLINELSNPNDIGEVSATILRLSAEYLDRGALFIAGDSEFTGISGFGAADMPARVQSLRIARKEPSILGDVAKSGEAHRGKMRRTAANVQLIDTLGGLAPSEVVALPIMHAKRTIGILYGDNAAHRAPIDTMTGLEIFLSQAGYAFGNAVFAAEKARR